MLLFVVERRPVCLDPRKVVNFTHAKNVQYRS